MDIFSWGANSYGQLSQGHMEDQLVPRPVTIPSQCHLEDVVSVTGGGGHTLILTKSGEVYGCGLNNRGQLGMEGKQNMLLLNQIQSLTGQSVVKVTAGWDFSCALTDEGKLLCFGSNAFSQLGVPDVKGHSASPKLVQLPGRVVDVSAGMRHVLACTDCGTVFAWGSGRKGQLGVSRENQPVHKVNQPERVVLPEGTGRVIQVAAGSYHSAALTEHGSVIVWGDNKHGVKVKVTSSLAVLHGEMFGNERVASIHSGWTHMIAKTESGSVFSWGRGDYGQLGRTLSSTDRHPGKIESLKNVQHVCCGSEHNMAITEDNNLVCWGWNEHGMCATGDEVNMNEPRKVNRFKDTSIINIGAGAGHCYVITRRDEHTAPQAVT